MNGDNVVSASLHWETPMKTIVSALIALSVISSLAAHASAFDARQFWNEYDRSHSAG